MSKQIEMDDITLLKGQRENAHILFINCRSP